MNPQTHYFNVSGKLSLVIALMLSCGMAVAQTPLDKPSLSDVTLISPYYFGPNAFAVPEMLRLSRSLLQLLSELVLILQSHVET
jgi:hypothetical protein